MKLDDIINSMTYKNLDERQIWVGRRGVTVNTYVFKILGVELYMYKLGTQQSNSYELIAKETILIDHYLYIELNTSIITNKHTHDMFV